ncbi:MAG: thiamine phosphate synthase [Propionibacteriales bacterium]|nr:thiamine phosphate synthase [Propionibacteriales bacterium]
MESAVQIPHLHLITDARGRRDPFPDIRAALDAGLRCIQVRAKEHTDREQYALARHVVDLARPHDATVLVDDRPDIALAVGAHGVHLGDDDLPVEAVRRILGPEACIGATARDPAGAGAAEAAGADYVGVGPAFATRTKTGLPPMLGADGVGAVARAVGIPVVAIGGVTQDNTAELLAAGAHGVAVVSAISEAVDPAQATAALLKVTEQEA